MYIYRISLFSTILFFVLFLLLPIVKVVSAQSLDICSVKSIRREDSGAQTWLARNKELLINKKDSSGIYQIYKANSDGSEQTCISCTAKPGSPQVDRNKVMPSWHPSGNWIILGGEMDTHWQPSPLLPKRVIEGFIINGLWSNLYVVSADGEKWYRLTNYSATKTDGVLGPRFSADGKKVLWARNITSGFEIFTNKFGTYDLFIADFVLDSQGIPSLNNIQTITPAGARWIEPHGFSPDGKKILFTADIGLTNAEGMDTWTMDLETGNLTNLTNSSDQWDEHARFSPDGKIISRMSSDPYKDSGPAQTLTLKSEIMIMNSDGSNNRQLTHFNTPGYVESTSERSVAGVSEWSADGSQLLAVQLLAGIHWPNTQSWIITFNGPCGNQNITSSPTPQNKVGDINHDNKVDIIDYTELVTTFGTQGENLPADINQNHTVDIYDYSLLVSNFDPSM